MMSSPFLILKIGGSLFSDKTQYRHVDNHAIREFARLVAELAYCAPGRVALILGGGSFGHGAVRHVDSSDRLAVLGLTEANFAQKWIWTQALRAEGAPAMPLQLAAMCALQADKLIVDGEVLQRSLAVGILPILSGDCLIGSDGSLHIFGSDRVPGALLRIVQKPARIIALTDTLGIICGAKGSKVLRHVDPDAAKEAYENLWSTPDHDTTGAMAGKLHAFLEFARQGAECFIMKGNPKIESLKFLLDPLETWPQKIVYTRIVRSSHQA